jgi:hypothetical protein
MRLFACHEFFAYTRDAILHPITPSLGRPAFLDWRFNGQRHMGTVIALCSVTQTWDPCDTFRSVPIRFAQVLFDDLVLGEA